MAAFSLVQLLMLLLGFSTLFLTVFGRIWLRTDNLDLLDRFVVILQNDRSRLSLLLLVLGLGCADCFRSVQWLRRCNLLPLTEASLKTGQLQVVTVARGVSLKTGDLIGIVWHNCTLLVVAGGCCLFSRACSCSTLVKAGLGLPQVFIDLLAICLDLPLILLQRRLLIEEQLLDQIVVNGRPLLVAPATLDIGTAFLDLASRATTTIVSFSLRCPFFLLIGASTLAKKLRIREEILMIVLQIRLLIIVIFT